MVLWRKKFGIAMADGHFYKGLLVLPLKENALHGKVDMLYSQMH